MIMRIWHGHTTPANAGAYEDLLKTRILPGIHRVSGYGGAWILRQNKPDEVEFITITTWDSWKAIEEFAGKSHAGAIVPDEARQLLSRFDERAEHYDAIWLP